EDIAFETKAGEDPAPQSTQVTSSGDPISGLDVDIEYADGQPIGWLEAELDGGTTPSELTLTPSVDGLAPGTYGATVTVTGADAEPAVLNVTLTVSEPDLIGLQLEIGGSIIGGGGLLDDGDLLELDLAELLSEPTLGVT